jgi:hypothetical protein
MGVGMGKFDETEDDLGGDGTAGLELEPGAEWEAEVLCHELAAILSEHLFADLTDAKGQIQVVVVTHDRPC